MPTKRDILKALEPYSMDDNLELHASGYKHIDIKTQCPGKDVVIGCSCSLEPRHKGFCYFSIKDVEFIPDPERGHKYRDVKKGTEYKIVFAIPKVEQIADGVPENLIVYAEGYNFESHKSDYQFVVRNPNFGKEDRQFSDVTYWMYEVFNSATYLHRTTVDDPEQPSWKVMWETQGKLWGRTYNDFFKVDEIEMKPRFDLVSLG